ncbi:hypothetical protein GCM10010218_38020 [Streptomyces mashuensis]|uniref:Uncharacterized protein n=1 Tax=Streptomyces mashuensis TaxID=33904 RepID=A0A919EDZ9_9ACTN|nr:hypothetical protein [Streptomyces mashuensis]GHF52960.1 hypothetical protein GCM10010218_38020 [Streptomyces mashuensis]
MTDFDIAVVMGEDTLDRAIAHLYGRDGLRSQLFSGKITGKILDEPITFEWALEEAPSLILCEPPEEKWAKAVGRKNQPPPRTPGAFTARLPRVRFGNSVDKKTSYLPVEVLCAFSSDSGVLGVVPLGVIADLSKEGQAGQRFYRYVIVPKVLHAIVLALGSVALPHLHVAGVEFGPFVLAAGQGRAVAVANSAERPAPRRPSPADFPADPFSILLAAPLVQRITANAFAEVKGRWMTTSGSSTFGIGRADYRGGLCVKDGTFTPVPGDPLTIRGSVGIEAYGDAQVDPFSGLEDALEKAGDTIGRALKSY